MPLYTRSQSRIGSRSQSPEPELEPTEKGQAPQHWKLYEGGFLDHSLLAMSFFVITPNTE